MKQNHVLCCCLAILISSPNQAKPIESRQNILTDTVLPTLVKILPYALNSISGSDSIDRNAIKDEASFSYQNLISMGLKLVLAFLTNSDQALEKADLFPTQAVMGTLISAVTGSSNPSEVSKMAKQATEVRNFTST
jgi:hypothetical protein